ncbi:MAG: hypothetical protein HOQ12_00990 [Gemmatimonadaceae bacterium]|nr:hypothetical protein [Gemmatimonadaceae bacterium]NUQ92153.1 hypothetical protein [Gemmatimonadaceae bacterium]NUR18084.1 hypothetical protein [Gemmatimonadaceae bacterium]
MPHHKRLTIASLTLVLASAALAPTASAQFGSIRSKVKKAVEKKVGGDKEQAASTNNGRAPMTEDRVAQLLKGMAAEAKSAEDISSKALKANAKPVADLDAYVKRWRAYGESQAKAKRQQEEYAACVTPYSQDMMSAAQNQPASVQMNGMAMAQKMESMSPAERDEFEKKMEKLEREAKAAEKSGNVAEQQRIRREVEKLTGVSMSNVSDADRQKMAANSGKAQKAAKGMQSCGPTPQPSRTQPPAAVMVRPIVQEKGQLVLGPAATQQVQDTIEAQTYVRNLKRMGVGKQPTIDGAAGAGMSTGDYDLAREQVVYYFAIPAMRGTETTSCTRAFTAPDCAVLQHHRAEIIAAAQRLREAGTLPD